MKTTLDFALAYIERGWKVFPLHSVGKDLQCTCGIQDCTDAGKHPRLETGLKGASRERAQIVEWFGRDAPPSNIGLVTGVDSGITVLDIDIGKKGGDKTWAELIKDAGEPDTLMAETGSGGLHVFFKYNSALNTSSNTLGPGVDCRNDKGYVVAAPSAHRSGGRYAWQDWSATLADLPVHLAKKRERRGRPKGNDPTRKRYTIEAVAGMLKFVPPEDRDIWRKVGIILGREFGKSDAAWQLYNDWSNTWGGKKGRNHDNIMREAFYSIASDDGDLSLGTIVYLALQGGWAPTTGQVSSEQFIYYAPGNNYIYRPTGTFWPGESVEAACSPVNVDGDLIKPSVWLRQNRLTTSMTNDPIIESEVTKGWDCLNGALIEAEGAALYNSYRKPTVVLGDARLARPFVDHVRKVFNKPGDADQFLNYMAHRVQEPGDKPRFALLIAGEQGVGKDTAISMTYNAIGHWNIANIDPSAFDQSFNEYNSAVLVVISEAANTHEMSKWAFNERTKNLIAGLPDYTTINPKYGQKYSVRLHCGVIITTNHMTTGLYIPPDDRRYDVIEAATRQEMGFSSIDERAVYFDKLWTWFNEDGGAGHVAAYLMDRDLSGWSASNGQRITAAHREIVSANMSSDEWLAEALEVLENPDVLRTDVLFQAVNVARPDSMRINEFAIKVAHALARAGFRKLINGTEKDGKWRLAVENGKKKSVTAFYRADKLNVKDATKALMSLSYAF